MGRLSSGQIACALDATQALQVHNPSGGPSRTLLPPLHGDHLCASHCTTAPLEETTNNPRVREWRPRKCAATTGGGTCCGTGRRRQRVVDLSAGIADGKCRACESVPTGCSWAVLVSTNGRPSFGNAGWSLRARKIPKGEGGPVRFGRSKCAGFYHAQPATPADHGRPAPAITQYVQKCSGCRGMKEAMAAWASPSLEECSPELFVSRSNSRCTGVRRRRDSRCCDR